MTHIIWLERYQAGCHTPSCTILAGTLYLSAYCNVDTWIDNYGLDETSCSTNNLFRASSGNLSRYRNCRRQRDTKAAAGVRISGFAWPWQMLKVFSCPDRVMIPMSILKRLVIIILETGERRRRQFLKAKFANETYPVWSRTNYACICRWPISSEAPIPFEVWRNKEQGSQLDSVM